jgi:F-type H+-transporting ATPase subunit epsilon
VQLRILLPSEVFALVENVDSIVATTPSGCFGLLPHRMDCAAVLTPGLLGYTTASTGDVHIAVDAGVMIKTGNEVLVCVRRAISGADLGQLQQAVQLELLKLSEQQQADRRTLAHLESGLIRDLVELQRA